jgi:hypothetical protein
VILQLTDGAMVATLLELFGLALSAAAVGGVAAAVYRWYAHDRLPEGIAILLGLTVVATWLNTSVALSQAIVGSSGLLAPETAAYTIVAFVVGGISADVARRFGDRLAARTFTFAGGDLDDVTRLVTTGKRPVSVTLPEQVGDIDGYDPVDPETKTAIEGETLLFPRNLTIAQLRDRLTTRLRDDYGVGAVDLQVAEDGTVEYLAVGSRAVGLGQTLPPGSVAVVVRADPPFTASPGDLVQVWSDEDEPSRLLTAELRAAVEDVVTLVVDESEAERLSPDGRYRLVTLPAERRADQEFASLLRAAEETMTAAEVGAGSGLDGTPVGALSVTVAAIQGEAGLEPIPGRERVLRAGETVFAIATPAALRSFEAAATGSGEAAADARASGGETAD